MKRFWILLCALALFGAACGNDSGGLGAFADGDGGSGGGGDDFCAEVLSINSAFDRLESDGVASIEENYGQIRDLANRAASKAPGDIRGDVETLASGVNQVYEALEDVDFDFSAIPDDAFDDIDTEMDAASDRVDAYCGTTSNDDGDTDDSGSDDGFGGDDDSTDNGGSDAFGGDDDSTDNGGSDAFGGDDGSDGDTSGDAFEDFGASDDGGSFGGDIPDDFPDELIPPDYDEVFSFNAGGVSSVSFEITATYDQVSGYYKDVLGEPSFEFSSTDGSSATWSEGTDSVTVIDNGDGTVAVAVTELDL